LNAADDIFFSFAPTVKCVPAASLSILAHVDAKIPLFALTLDLFNEEESSRITTEKVTNPALMKPMRPSAELAEIVGTEPLARTEITKRIWDYPEFSRGLVEQIVLGRPTFQAMWRTSLDIPDR